MNRKQTFRARSYIYFIRGEITGLIKIGFTTGDPQKRLRSLQCGSPDILKLVAVKPGEHLDELRLHQRFSTWRRHGEWFIASAELLEYIEGCRKAGK